MSSRIEELIKSMPEPSEDGMMPQLTEAEMSNRVEEEMKRMEEEHKRKTGRYMPSHDDVEDFLSKVENVHSKVKDIIDGKVDLDEFDKEEHR